MVSTFTPNVQIEEPARGDDVGTWDTPVNANMTLIDLVLGGIATIALNNSPVVLAAAQFRSKQITFNSTLTGSVTITFPTSFTKSYEIQNLCTGSSAFVITLATTAAGGQVICCPPGETIDCFNDGTNIKFKNLARIGTIWDFIGSSVPAWVSGCTVPPYLNCDGSTFSATTYPQLAVVLGSTTLPDIRGTTHCSLNQGTGRMTFAVNGNINGSIGGVDSVTLNANQIPSITSAGSVTFGGKFIAEYTAPASFLANIGGAVGVVYDTGGPSLISFANAATATATSNNTGGAAHSNVQPTTIAGLTLLRAG